MKVTITINIEKGWVRPTDLVLFGARHNHHAVCYGNSSTLRMQTYFDDDYRKFVGLPDDYNDVDMGYSGFLMDCIKYDFRINRINGKPLMKTIKDTDPFTYEEVPFNKFNPYIEEYRISLGRDCETEFEIELYPAKK
ncbi:MAG: hypothetical protein NT084_02695 [Bacteroidetes bacterium]|nr:hypothetical protein [Bacteroidota bacterium]